MIANLVSPPRLAVAGLLVVALVMPLLSGGDEAACPSYKGPVALAASADGATLYVASADACEVAWIELASGAVVRRAAMPAAPSGLALSADGQRLFVSCAAPNSTVVVLDAATGHRLATIPAGHTSTALVASACGRWLYVCNRFDNDVSVIDLPASKEVARVAVEREPMAAALMPDGRTLVVANHLPRAAIGEPFANDVSAALTLIDTSTRETTAVRLPHGSNGVRGLCLSPDGRHAFVVHLLSNFDSVPFRVDGGWINCNVVSVVDLAERMCLATVGLDVYGRAAGNPWDVVVSGDGKRLCVSLAGTHELCVVDTAELLNDSAELFSPTMGVWPIYPSLGSTPWRRIGLKGKGPRGLALVGSKVYAAEYFSDTVAAVDLAADDEDREKTPAGSLPLGPPPQLTDVRRGELLFHDATLCLEHWQSCASCHPDGRVDALNWDLLNDGEGNPKNTKSMLYAHETPPAMAEGIRMSAEVAVRSGIEHVLFSDPKEADALAIDVYLKSLRPVPSPRLVGGKPSEAAERGRALFFSERVACDRCHPPPFYTDMISHNVGTRATGPKRDRFDTPTLVEVWRTAPYLHDGRYATLDDLFRFGRHGLANLRGAELSDDELADLVEFVLSL
jgi:YVTN family beta-propeller protein